MDTKNIASEIIRRLIEYNEPVTNWKVLLQQMRSDGFDIDKPGMNLLLSKLEKDGWIARPNADTITLERKEDYLKWDEVRSKVNSQKKELESHIRSSLEIGMVKEPNKANLRIMIIGVVLTAALALCVTLLVDKCGINRTSSYENKNTRHHQ